MPLLGTLATTSAKGFGFTTRFVAPPGQQEYTTPGTYTWVAPAGVTSVEGDFEAGDPVDLVDSSGQLIARGLVAYDAHEIPALLGRSTSDLAAELGDGYGRELVHRDDLVLL